MKKIKFEVQAISFIIAFIFNLITVNLCLPQEQSKMLEGLEKKEKIVPQETIIRPQEEYKSEDARDPFQSSPTKAQKSPGELKTVEATGEAEKKPLPSLVVQGLIWGGNFPQAIVDNKVVKIGDTVGGARITDISKNGVTVFLEGREYNLSSPAMKNANPKGK